MAEKASGNQKEDPFLLMVLCTIAIAAVFALATSFAGEIRRVTTIAAWVLVAPFASLSEILAGIPVVGHWLLQPASAAEPIASAALHRKEITQAEWLQVQTVAGRLAFACCSLPLLTLALGARRLRPDLIFRRKHDFESLLDAQARVWPLAGLVRCMEPLTARTNPARAVSARVNVNGNARNRQCGKLLEPTLAMPDPPAMEIALRPETWLQSGGLASLPPEYSEDGTARFSDRAWLGLGSSEVSELLIPQLGPSWNGFEDLPPMYKALAAILSLHLEFNEIGCRVLQETIALRAREAWTRGVRLDEVIRTDPPLLDEVLKVLKSNCGRAALSEANRHGWRKTAFMGMLEAARKRSGVLGSASLLWLKREDRSLWYALNSTGNAVAVAEAAGALSHFRAECRAGQPLLTPMVAQAAHATIDDYLDLNRKISGKRKASIRTSNSVGRVLEELARRA